MDFVKEQIAIYWQNKIAELVMGLVSLGVVSLGIVAVVLAVVFWGRNNK